LEPLFIEKLGKMVAYNHIREMTAMFPRFKLVDVEVIEATPVSRRKQTGKVKS
jgi:hypothetical protein